MTLPINNQVYTAAYAGALAGMGVGSRMLSANTSIASLAGAWASSFDAVWNSATQIDQLQHDAIQNASTAAWLSLSNILVDSTTLAPATYTNQIQQIVAQIAAGESYFTSQGNTPPPYGGGGSINPLMAALVFVATLATPGISQAAPAGTGNQTGYTTTLSAQNGQTNNPGQGGQGGNYVIQGGAGGGSSTAVANTNGGNVIAEPGAAGTGGSGAAGHSGYFIVSPAGVPAIQMGFVSGSVAALWNGGVSPSTSNYGLTLASTQTTLNSPSLPLSLSIANISIWEIAAVGGASSLALGTPSSTNFALSTDGLTETTVNAPADGGSGLVNLAVGGTTAWQAGLFIGSVPTIWPGGVTPSNTNFAIICESTATLLNAPASGLVQLTVGGNNAWQVGLIGGTTSALYSNVTAGPNNYALAENSSETIINGPTSGYVFSSVNGVPFLKFGALVGLSTGSAIYGSAATPTANNFMIATDNVSVTQVNAPTTTGYVDLSNGGTVNWQFGVIAGGSSPAIYSAGSTTSTGFTLLSTNAITILNVPSSSGLIGLAAQAGVMWQFSNVPSTSLNGIYGGSISISSTNYAFAWESTTTIVNGPGSIIFANNGVSEWQMQPLSGAAALYANAVSPGSSNFTLLVTPAGGTVLNAQASSPSTGAVSFAVDGTVCFGMSNSGSGINQLIAGNFQSTPCFAVDSSGDIEIVAPNTGGDVLITAGGSAGGEIAFSVASGEVLVLGGTGLEFGSVSFTLTTANATLTTAQAATAIKVILTGSITASSLTFTFPASNGIYFVDMSGLGIGAGNQLFFRNANGDTATFPITSTSLANSTLAVVSVTSTTVAVSYMS